MSEAAGPSDAVAAVEGATLGDLQRDYAAQWQAVGAQMVDATRAGPSGLQAFAARQQQAAELARRTLAKHPRRGAAFERALQQLAAARMALLATAEVAQAAASQLAAPSSTTPAQGLSWWSGSLINALLFERGQGLTRKPASLSLLRLLWPLIPQRRRLMPLVQPRGIYCFYSRELVAALGAVLGAASGEGPCLELGAGDGTLARFLAAAGVDVRAVDDHSWAHTVAFPGKGAAVRVERQDAAEALDLHRPRAVLCSFPPANNRFERRVFRTASVEVYVVITTRHRGAAGDWDAYDEQTAFDVDDNAALSAMVWPPELDPLVRVFRRKPRAAGENVNPP